MSLRQLCREKAVCLSEHDTKEALPYLYVKRYLSNLGA